MDRWAELFGRILAIYFNLRWVSCHLLFFMDFFFRPKQGTLDSFNENLDSSHDFWFFFLFLISFRSFRLNAYSLLFRWLSYIHFFFFFAIWLWREMNIFIGTSDFRECWSSAWGKTDSRNITLIFFCRYFSTFRLLSLSFPSDPRTFGFTLSRDALEVYEALDKTSFQGLLLMWHILASVDRKVKFEVSKVMAGRKVAGRKVRLTSNTRRERW